MKEQFTYSTSCAKLTHTNLAHENPGTLTLNSKPVSVVSQTLICMQSSSQCGKSFSYCVVFCLPLSSTTVLQTKHRGTSAVRYANCMSFCMSFHREV
jgi:hypothetical protein